MASFAEALKKRLKPELYTQVLDELGDDFDLDLVPRSRLNKVVAQRNELRDQLGASSTENDEFTVSKPGVTAEPSKPSVVPPQPDPGLKKSDVDLEELERKHAAALRERDLRYAVLSKLRNAGAVDPELIYDAKLLNLKDVKDGENSGTFIGIDEAIATLLENKDRAYLFGKTVTTGTGKTGASEPKTTEITREDFNKLGYMERLKYKEDHPESYKKLLEQKG